MSRLFILEGPDCSGKTSLAKRICLMRKAMYLHAGGDRNLQSGMLSYHLSLVKSAKENMANGHDAVIDRLWPSEYVYGNLFRPELQKNYDYVAMFIALASVNLTYIFCNDDQVEIRHAAEQDPDHPYDNRAFSAVVAEYRKLEQTMRQQDMLPGFQPGAKSGDFKVVYYSILANGTRMSEFVEKL